MIIQTTDHVLYNISIFGRDSDVDCAVDIMQFANPLHLNEYETVDMAYDAVYMWWGDSGTLHEELDFWESEGYTIEMEVVEQ